MNKRLLNSITLLILSTSGTGCFTDNSGLQPLTQPPKPMQPDTVAIRILNYTPLSGNTYKDLFVSNFSVKTAKNTLSLSSARDGLTDDFKRAHNVDYGFTIDGPFSNPSSFSDIFLYLSGVTLAQQNSLFCGSDKQGSSSNDAFTYSDDRTTPPTTQFLGLRDCEKSYLDLSVTKFDNNGNGIPDYLKLRCGLNPKNTKDANLSIANDSISNKDKCKMNLPLDESADSAMNQLYAYKYNVELLPSGGRNFTVSNIPILNGGIQNFIAIYLTESSVTHVSSLYTAYLVLKSNYIGKTININYWVSSSNPVSTYTNQEITPK